MVDQHSVKGSPVPSERIIQFPHANQVEQAVTTSRDIGHIAAATNRPPSPPASAGPRKRPIQSPTPGEDYAHFFTTGYKSDVFIDAMERMDPYEFNEFFDFDKYAEEEDSDRRSLKLEGREKVGMVPKSESGDSTALAPGGESKNGKELAGGDEMKNST